MEKLACLVRSIDKINLTIGRIFSWSVLIMTLLTFGIVVMRYGFDYGKIWIQESLLYIHGIFFMAVAGFTLVHNEHVRVDAVYSVMNDRFRNWVNLLGSLLLLTPTCIFIIYYSWPYVFSSWKILESSGQPGGLPIIYIFKSFILFFGVTLLIQAVAEILRAWLKLNNFPMEQKDV